MQYSFENLRKREMDGNRPVVCFFTNKESFLWSGAISPRFQVCGTSDFAIIMFMRSLSGLSIVGADALRALGGIESCPLALFDFTYSSTDLTS